MKEIRALAKRRWRENKRRRIKADAARRFVSAFFFGAAGATLAAIILGAIKQ
jgi:hypothetical protein